MSQIRLCSIDGCSRHYYGRGLCNMHYMRFRRRGSTEALWTEVGTPMAFIESAIKYDLDDCLIWPFSRGANGYGRIRVGGVNKGVHRVICEYLHGNAPSQKHQAAHSCGKGHLGCCSPLHISWKTPAENQADRIVHGTTNRGERYGRVKLTEDNVREIRCAYPLLSQYALAKKFNVSKSCIFHVLAGNSWRHINAE